MALRFFFVIRVERSLLQNRAISVARDKNAGLLTTYRCSSKADIKRKPTLMYDGLSVRIVQENLIDLCISIPAAWMLVYDACCRRLTRACKWWKHGSGRPMLLRSQDTNASCIFNAGYFLQRASPTGEPSNRLRMSRGWPHTTPVVTYPNLAKLLHKTSFRHSVHKADD